jgi:hypothetical protein
MAMAAARTARPTISPPTSRVLNGNVAAASVIRTSRALGKVAEYGLGLALAPGETVGNRPPGELAGLGRVGRVACGSVAPGTVGRMPAGMVAPTPVGVVLVDGVGDGDGDGECDAAGLAVMVTAPDAGGGAVASLDLAVPDSVACLPAAVLDGTDTLACSSSELPLAIPPTVQVRPLADGQTVNLGVTVLPATWALIVTLTPLAAPPAGQTQIA